MEQKISENTEIKLDLKTIGTILGFTVALVSMYFALKSDIAKAMELPAPEISKIEWTYKDDLIRSNISNTNEKVEGLEKSVSQSRSVMQLGLLHIVSSIFTYLI